MWTSDNVLKISIYYLQEAYVSEFLGNIIGNILHMDVLNMYIVLFYPSLKVKT